MTSYKVCDKAPFEHIFDDELFESKFSLPEKFENVNKLVWKSQMHRS